MSMTRSTYSEKLREAMDDIRPAFRDIGHGFEQLTKKRAAIAPAFMKAYTLWQRETRRTFVAFVHELDPSMPVNGKAYIKHASYQAALYLQQLTTNPEENKRKGLTPLAMLATVIKSFLPLYATQKDQLDALQALVAATKWRDRDQRRLLVAIKRARPVALPKVPRLVEAAKATKALVVAFERERGAA
jgi:hypothetical protein